MGASRKGRTGVAAQVPEAIGWLAGHRLRWAFLVAFSAASLGSVAFQAPESPFRLLAAATALVPVQKWERLPALHMSDPAPRDAAESRYRGEAVLPAQV